MTDQYCSRGDVLDVLEEADLPGLYDQQPRIIDAAITSQTEHIRNETNRHWYESDGRTASAPVTASEQRYDVPSSPHAQATQRYHDDVDRYPVSTHGRYCKIRLDHADVQSLTALAVRDASGDITDWVADSDKIEGRGEDYYLSTPTDGGLAGRTALFIHEASLPVVTDYNGLLTLEYEYGTSPISDTVRRITALLAASQLVTADEFVTAIPDNGQLVNVETKANRWEDTAETLLDNYRATPS